MYQKTIKLFLYDGNPNERIICELSNWNGIAYKIPKAMLKDSDPSKLSYIDNTGVYFLIGDKDEIPSVYIGESENLYKRLLQHLSDNKDFWEECIVFTRTDNSLNKAHVKFMENALYKSAKKSARYEIDNNTVPAQVTLSLTDKAEMIEVMDNIKMLTNVLGYKIFIDSKKPIVRKDKVLYLKSSLFSAKGIETNEGFVVLSGSKVNKKESSSLRSGSLALRRRLMEQNIIDDNYTFTENYVFNSSSAAGRIISGYSISGPQNWKNVQGKTLKQINEKI